MRGVVVSVVVAGTGAGGVAACGAQANRSGSASNFEFIVNPLERKGRDGRFFGTGGLHVPSIIR
jgi:hypothetical protein